MMLFLFGLVRLLDHWGQWAYCNFRLRAVPCKESPCGWVGTTLLGSSMALPVTRELVSACRRASFSPKTMVEFNLIKLAQFLEC